MRNPITITTQNFTLTRFEGLPKSKAVPGWLLNKIYRTFIYDILATEQHFHGEFVIYWTFGSFGTRKEEVTTKTTNILQAYADGKLGKHDNLEQFFNYKTTIMSTTKLTQDQLHELAAKFKVMPFGELQETIEGLTNQAAVETDTAFQGELMACANAAATTYNDRAGKKMYELPLKLQDAQQEQKVAASLDQAVQSGVAEAVKPGAPATASQAPAAQAPEASAAVAQTNEGAAIAGQTAEAKAKKPITRSKISDEQVASIRQLLSDGFTPKEVVALPEYAHIHYSTVGDMVKGISRYKTLGPVVLTEAGKARQAAAAAAKPAKPAKVETPVAAANTGVAGAALNQAAAAETALPTQAQVAQDAAAGTASIPAGEVAGF